MRTGTFELSYPDLIAELRSYTRDDLMDRDEDVRLTMRPLLNVTLISRYEFQSSIIHTKPDSSSGLGEVESSEMTSHIFAQSISWSPWSRLYL